MLQKLFKKITPFSYPSIIIQFLIYSTISLTTLFLITCLKNIYISIPLALLLSILIFKNKSTTISILSYLFSSLISLFLLNTLNSLVTNYIFLILMVLIFIYTIFFFPKNISKYHPILNLLLFSLLGILFSKQIFSQPTNINSLNHLNYDLIFLNALVLTIFIILTTGITNLYAMSYSIQMEKIKIIDDKLKGINKSLKLEVIKKTKELISSKTKLLKSQKYLEEAYKSLDSSEQDRFTKMNLLSHYSVMLSSVIHDVNNPLMYVMNSIKDKKMKNKDELLDSLESVTAQLNEVRSNLRIEKESFNFNAIDIVKTAIKILDWKIQNNSINLKLDLDTSINLSHGSSQFKDIVLNLFDNAIDAVRDIEKPEITIKIERKNDYGYIVITDNGLGISKKDFKKIFNIFYSTKDSGNGIGLYIANKYAKEEFQGDISFTSEPRNTVFVFKFLIS